MGIERRWWVLVFDVLGVFLGNSRILILLLFFLSFWLFGWFWGSPGLFDVRGFAAKVHNTVNLFCLG